MKEIKINLSEEQHKKAKVFAASQGIPLKEFAALALVAYVTHWELAAIREQARKK